MTALTKTPGEQRSVPLFCLDLSEENVRGAAGEDATLGQLKASIAELGVLTPLVVVPGKPKRGRPAANAPQRFAVIAGGRRLRALRALANDLAIGENYAVPVVVRDAADAVTEISLAENRLREPLKPHEEFAAFARMAESGLDAPTIAQHFGVPLRRVEQLLRLGQLAPPVFEAFAAGTLTQAQAQAFASTSDHELQASIFDILMKKRQWEREPYQIKHLILGDSNALLAKLRAVGLEAYTAAGGVFDADLFGAEEYQGRVVNPDILERLYEEKRETELAELTAAHPDVEIVPNLPWNAGQKVKGRRGELTGALKEKAETIAAAIAEKRKALAALCDEDDNLLEDADEEAAHQLDDEIGALEEQLEGLTDCAPMVIDAQWIPEGCKLVAAPELDERSGRWMLDDFQIVPADWSIENQVQAQQPPSAPSAPRAKDGFVSREQKIKDAHGLGQESVEVMKAHRQRILQALLLTGADGVAGRDFLAFAIIRTVRTSDYSYTVGLADGFRPDASGPVHEEANEQRAYDAVERFVAERDRAWLDEKDPAKSLQMWLALDWRQRAEWESYATALVLSRSINFEGFGCGPHDVLGTAISATPEKIRELWTPDEAYWRRVPKKHQLAALGSIDEKLVEVSKNLGKDELRERCVAVFAGDQGLLIKLLPQERAARATKAALAWVPEYLQFRDLTPAHDDANLDSADLAEAAE